MAFRATWLIDHQPQTAIAGTEVRTMKRFRAERPIVRQIMQAPAFRERIW
jgi:hypothetical protein